MSDLWNDLAAALADPEHFAAWWALDRDEVLRAWAALEENSHHRVATTYAAALGDPEAPVPYGPGLAKLLEFRGLGAEAHALANCLLENARQGGDLAALQTALGDHLRTAAPVTDETREASRERLRLCRQFGDLAALQDALLAEASLRFWYDGLVRGDEGAGRDACRLLREQRRLCHRTGNRHGLQRSLHERAWTLFIEGRPGPMPRLLALQERLCREIGESEDLCSCLMAQAFVFSARVESRPRAWACLEEAEGIARDLGWRTKVDAASREKAVLALLEGDAAKAERVLRDAGAVPANTAGPSPLERTLTAALEYRTVELDTARFPRGARDAYVIIERFARAVGDAGCLQWALGQLARELEGSDPDTALQLAGQREAICRELEREDERFDALELQARLLLTRGRPTAALAVLREQTELCRDSATDWRLPRVRQVQRRALEAAIVRCADLRSALTLHEELELVCRELGDRSGARAAARGRARLLRKLGREPRRRLSAAPEQLSLGL